MAERLLLAPAGLRLLLAAAVERRRQQRHVLQSLRGAATSCYGAAALSAAARVANAGRLRCSTDRTNVVMGQQD